eukprot:scaffold52965_cov65-Phaeocystis_antarctica.AAC.1
MSAVLPVRPPMDRSEASALASSSTCTTEVSPLTAAPIRAVPPPPFGMLTHAPRCSRTRTIPSCPPTAAAFSRVPRSAFRASTPPPYASHAATASVSPSLAAHHITFGSSSFETCTAAFTAASIAERAAFFLPSSSSFLAAAPFSASPPTGSFVGASAAASAESRAGDAVAVASVSASCRSACCLSSCAVAVCCSLSAHMSAVLPLTDRSEALALASSSTCTTEVCPWIAATIRLVTPPAAAFSRLPPCSAHRASTPPPSSSHAATTCASPACAALHTEFIRATLHMPAGSASSNAAGLGATETTAVGSVAEGAALTFFLPLPIFLAAAPFSAAPPTGGSAGAAGAASAASCAADAAFTVASVSASCRLACCRSSSTVAVCFFLWACTRAVLPSMARSEASALASSSTCTVAVWPLIAATIRAVEPVLLECRSMLAPCCSNTRTVAACPPVAAAISSVESSRSVQRASRNGLRAPQSNNAAKSRPSRRTASQISKGSMPIAASATFRSACCLRSCAVAACFRASAAMFASPESTASCMSCSAVASAVLPPSVCSQASASASSSTCTIAVWPPVAACTRAVAPSLSCRSTYAPRCSSIRTIASSPPSAAAISSEGKP